MIRFTKLRPLVIQYFARTSLNVCLTRCKTFVWLYKTTNVDHRCSFDNKMGDLAQSGMEAFFIHPSQRTIPSSPTFQFNCIMVWSNPGCSFSDTWLARTQISWACFISSAVGCFDGHKSVFLIFFFRFSMKRTTYDVTRSKRKRSLHCSVLIQMVPQNCLKGPEWMRQPSFWDCNL